jgi:hypothetical protein
VQRFPTYTYSIYFKDSYLPQNEAPALGKPVWLKLHNVPDPDLAGQYYDVSSMLDEGKHTYLTEGGEQEDRANTPYPIVADYHNMVMTVRASLSASAIDQALPAEVRNHNRGMGTVPVRVVGYGDAGSLRYLVRARSPPQPGGISCLGSNCTPTWAADAPSFARTLVRSSELETLGSVMGFRR